jgi:ATP/maltotriose-dependent transcriptional regulator MalT
MPEDWLQQLEALLTAGELAAAEQFILKHLALLEARDEMQGGFYLSLLNELASLYRGIGRLAEAEDLFRRMLSALEEAGQAGMLSYATAHLNLAGCYRLMGNFAEALTHYHVAEGVLSDLDRSPRLSAEERCRLRYLTASALNNVSLLYCDLDKLDEALMYAKHAATAIKNGVADEHELATSHNNLANIYLKLGRHAEADAANRAALDIYEQTLHNNVHHAAALNTFALLRFNEGDYDRAETAFEEALALTERYYGHNADYLSVERSLARVRDARARTGPAGTGT